jgi:hypothetical protein
MAGVVTLKGEQMPLVVLDDRRCRAIASSTGKPCAHRAKHDGLCYVHLRDNRIPPKHTPMTGKMYVYVMGGDTPLVKIGQTRDLSWRCYSLKTGTGLASRQPGFQVLTFRPQALPGFTEKTVHGFLGNDDRVEGEWWQTTENVLIRLALCGLTWPQPFMKCPGR